MVPPATLVVRIGTKVNISTMYSPRLNIKVSKLLYQQTASDEIIKVPPPATLVVRIGTKANISTTGRLRANIKVSKLSLLGLNQTKPNQTKPNQTKLN